MVIRHTHLLRKDLFARNQADACAARAGEIEAAIAGKATGGPDPITNHIVGLERPLKRFLRIM